MTNSAEAFEKKHNIAATRDDVTKIKNRLRKFYKAVETIDRPHDGYIQLYHGDAVRKAAESAFGASIGQTWTLAMDAAIAIREMPEEWSTKYRASVAYHLAPILSDVVNS
ncbi:hypothetical protein [Phyllobacterium meliloti]|uniref:hypothetical protein n=1 Tax=Phyllobacterium meliloti TaxID=555317 RepID=UPI001D138804|nr:hypothetical protein [Phyllobacterium sp. T1293]UGX87105.1 hypothetical protein LLE53_004460 [Phyllobacterium sp. T1293]